ncbi:MAG: thioredoxin domain-containing protein [Terriglobia bacterium]
MKLKVLPLFGFVLACSLLPAQTETDDPVLVRRIQERLRIPATYTIILGPPEPAALAGLVKRQMEVSDGKNTRREVIYLSADGQYLFRGHVFDLAGPSLAERLAQVSTENHPSLGPKNAKVTIIEYGDFQCPYCERTYWVVKYKVLRRYADQVRLVYKDFPLTRVHPWAMQAAIAGQCGYQQSNEAFWKMHDFLFENQDELNSGNIRAKLLKQARTPGLDVERFERCFDSREPLARIQKSIAEARELGLTGTPAFVVGGQLLRGAAPFTAFRAAIEEHLKAQRQAGTTDTQN